MLSPHAAGGARRRLPRARSRRVSLRTLNLGSMDISDSGLEKQAILILPATAMQPEKRGKISKGAAARGQRQSAQPPPADFLRRLPGTAAARRPVCGGCGCELWDSTSGGSTTPWPPFVKLKAGFFNDHLYLIVPSILEGSL